MMETYGKKSNHLESIPNREVGPHQAADPGWTDGRVPLPRDRSRFYACRAFDGDLDIYRRRAAAAASKTKSRARGGGGRG